MKLPEIKISVKLTGTKKTHIDSIKNSADLYQVLKRMFSKDTVYWTEELILICLNNAAEVIGYYKVSKGGASGTVCDPKIIFTTALHCAGTTQIVISHNHPSGSLNPSQADKILTRRIKEGGDILAIKLIDHIIYTEDGFYSFSDEGEL